VNSNFDFKQRNYKSCLESREQTSFIIPRYGRLLINRGRQSDFRSILETKIVSI
jgi:hypothetical protein